MGFLDFFLGKDINKGLEEFKGTAGAVLVDVRTEDEYQGGHIPGSINIPLDRIASFPQLIKDKDTPIFSYCHSGSRSGSASSYLHRLGYTKAQNIGGIMKYKGPLE